MGNPGDWPDEEPTRRLPKKGRVQDNNTSSPTDRTREDSIPDQSSQEGDQGQREPVDPGATQYLDYRHDSQGTEYLPDRSLARAPAPDTQQQQMDPLSRGIRRFGDYHITGKLSDGGMSWVYVATQKFEDFEDRKEVVLKVLQPRVTSELFRAEVNTLIELGNHPNIMFVFDGGTAIGLDPQGYRFEYQWMAMPQAKGGSLKGRLEDYRDQGEHMPLDEVNRILEGTAAALDYAHQKGRVHRDIKPGNILFGQHDEILLSDFGITLDVSETGRSAAGGGTGTPPYMAPEQWGRGDIDARTDTYGLGAMFFEMVTNEVPYPTDDVMAMQYRAVNEPVPSARKRYGKVPGAVDKVLSKSLAKDPDDRYQTAGELSKAFTSAVGRKRKVILAGLLFVFLLLISSGITYALVVYDEPSAEVIAKATAAVERAEEAEQVVDTQATALVDQRAKSTAAAEEAADALAVEHAEQTAVAATAIVVAQLTTDALDAEHVQQTAVAETATTIAQETAEAIVEITRVKETSDAATAIAADSLTATWTAMPRVQPGIYTLSNKIETIVDSANDNAGNRACTITSYFGLDQATVNPDLSIELFFSRWVDYDWAARFSQNPCQVSNLHIPVGMQYMYLIDSSGNKLYHDGVTGFFSEEFTLEEGQKYKGTLQFPAPTPGAVEFAFNDEDEGYSITDIRLAD